MKLTYCTITGADDKIVPAELAKISEQYPFVEWAIVILPNLEGAPRCPTKNWIAEFVEACSRAHKSAHLTEDAVPKFIKGDSYIGNIVSKFDRIQLNLGFQDAYKNCNPESLAARIRMYPDKNFIIQYSEQNKDILPFLKALPGHSLLLDGSMGRGISPDSWPAPHEGRLCGYAGGLNPSNLAEQLARISRTVEADAETWIDMESGVRTNNEFNLVKVRHVLSIAKPYAIETPHVTRPLLEKKL